MIVPDLIKAVEAGQEKARLEIQGKHCMNERIRQLALQAGLKQRIWNSLGKELPMWQEDPDNPGLEKFAELIVRECADAIIKDSRLNDVRSAANGCVRTINEYFGVVK